MKLNCDRNPKMVIGDVNGINNLTPLQLTSNETIILGEKFNYEDMSFKEKLDVTYRIANICKSELAFVDNYNKNLKDGEKPKRIQIKRRLDESGYSRFVESSTKFLDKEYMKSSITYNQRLWHVINNNYSIQLCPVCQNKRSFNVNLNGYNDFCSRKCGINNMENRSNDIVISRVKEENVVIAKKEENENISETINLIAKWKGCEKEEIEKKFKESGNNLFSFEETRKKLLDLFKGGQYSQYENRYGDLIDSIKSNTRFLDEEYKEINILQRVWHIVFDRQNIIKCQSCNKPQTFIICLKGYNNFCGSSCHQMYKKTFNGEKPENLPVLTKHRENPPKVEKIIENLIKIVPEIIVKSKKPEIGDYAYVWINGSVYYGLIISSSINVEDFAMMGEKKFYYTLMSQTNGEIKFYKDNGIYSESKEGLLELVKIEAEKAKMEIINNVINNLNELK